ncbi:hypothetical protein O181_095559 [Austropuccinia psidii MF-1]|uniref:Peptidase A2 domain-containing protein n=1 Tax=Austropuccinia psidii MF-1 TaxID=1389203 RepID=A0A9Q3PBV4_9BASI|nr:hypothetical protein [Austropuccinia psidii MF-1]
MKVFVGNKEYPVMALFDAGSELNIITEVAEIKSLLPNREIKNSRGMGGHTTSLLRLAELTQLLLPSGQELESYFLIFKEAVHIVLGISFLADNSIRLEFSQKKGEIFGYQKEDGRRLCIPICKPHILGWKTGPQRGMELC